MFAEKPGRFLHDLKAEAAEVSAELRHSFGLPRFFRPRRRKLKNSAGDQYHVVREEVHVIAVAIFGYTQEKLQKINQTEIEPFRDAVAEEIHNLREEAGRSPDIIAVRDFAKSAASQLSSAGRKHPARGKEIGPSAGPAPYDEHALPGPRPEAGSRSCVL